MGPRSTAPCVTSLAGRLRSRCTPGLAGRLRSRCSGMTQSSLRTPVRSALCHIACRSTSVPVHSWALRSTSVPVLRHDTELAADSRPQRSVSRHLPVDFGPAAWVQGLLRDVCKPLRPDLHVLSVETVACRTLSGSVQAKDRQTLAFPHRRISSSSAGGSSALRS